MEIIYLPWRWSVKEEKRTFYNLLRVCDISLGGF
jgi:hypothetical protein